MERKKSLINNAFYDALSEGWLSAEDHPIALLRSENTLRNPWIIKTIEEQKGLCKILDIGCGAGLLTTPLAKLGHSVSGIDSSVSSLEVARNLGKGLSAEYIEGKAEALPFEDASFDVVSAMDLLEHVENPAKVIEEASRVLTPGGLFFFHTFNRNPISYLLIIKGVDWFVRNAPKNMHVYSLFIKPREMKNLCLLQNLKVEHMFGMRPDFKAPSFLKMLLTGKVDPNFRFVFTPSLITGYLGFAKKTG